MTMRVTRRAAVIGAVAVAIGGPGLAQQPKPAEDDAVVSELVVRAYGGPAWWTVSDADTTVYVLALPNTVPKGMAWSRTLLDKRLTGANALILPVESRTPVPSPIDMYKIFRAQRGMTKGKPTLEPSLPPALRARFATARQAVKQPEQRYGSFAAGTAAMLLAGDTLKVWFPPVPPPPQDNVRDTIVAAAKAKKVKVEKHRYTGPMAGFNVMIKDLLAPGQACMAAILTEIEKGPAAVNRERADAAGDDARRWADGDVRPLLESMSRAEHADPAMNINVNDISLFLPSKAWPTCIKEMPNTPKLVTAFIPIPDEVEAIKTALKKPGHAVALIYPYPLLIRNGVLDRLRKQGITVTAPGA